MPRSTSNVAPSRIPPRRKAGTRQARRPRPSGRRRPTGIVFSIASIRSGATWATIGPSMAAGATAFTVTPWCASRSRHDGVNRQPITSRGGSFARTSSHSPTSISQKERISTSAAARRGRARPPRARPTAAAAAHESRARGCRCGQKTLLAELVCDPIRRLRRRYQRARRCIRRCGAASRSLLRATARRDDRDARHSISTWMRFFASLRNPPSRCVAARISRGSRRGLLCVSRAILQAHLGPTVPVRASSATRPRQCSRRRSWFRRRPSAPM